MSSIAHRTPETDTPVPDAMSGTPYRVCRRLSSGSAGDVFVVEHRELGSEFVAKVLHEQLLSDPQMVDRVRIEAQALGKLYHPNIVAALGYGVTVHRRPYLITEYLCGETLGARLRSGRLPPLEALVYACQILWALGAAHSIGVVHRDIKPENLFLMERPDAMPQLKVLDFSIARVMPGLSAQSPWPLVLPTETGVIVGTPRYISPEAVLGQHVDHRADIYSVGIVLYQMLTGRTPFDGARTNTDMLVAHLTEEPMPPSHLVDTAIMRDMDAIVLKALQKKPEDRYQSAKEFESALTEITGKWLTNDEVAAEASLVSDGSLAVHNPVGVASPANTEPFSLVQSSREASFSEPHSRRYPLVLYLAVAVAAAAATALPSLLRSLAWR